MLTGLLIWGHASAALLFGALALWALRREHAPDLPPDGLLAAALATTALWALSVAGIGTTSTVTLLLEGGRTLGWLAVLFAVQRLSDGRHGPAVTLAFGAVAAVDVVQTLLHFLAAGTAGPDMAAVAEAATMLRALAALGALALLHGMFPATASASARLVLLAAGALWLIDANFGIVRYLIGSVPGELGAARGFAVTALAGMIALALSRRGGGAVQLSRAVAFHSLSLLGLAAYFAVTIMAVALIAALGGGYARLLQAAFVFGSTAAVVAAASSGWLRAWARVKLAKHFFRHRYDYRAEWTRFTETLGEPKGGAPLDERLVKALADLTDSPAGLLLVADGGALAVQASWRWDGEVALVEGAPDLARYLADTGRILEIDAVRHGQGSAADAQALPGALLAQGEAWALVPLPHLGQLTGAILLARPPVPRALDWEDFDLLRIAGRQVASYLAEARAQGALAEARRFEEFNRRFAFILHDVKNIVSQLSLVARNAQRHADNPDFRADMVATLNESAARMNDLLARLAEREPPRIAAAGAVALDGVALRAALRFRLRGEVVVEGDGSPLAAADPARLQQVVDHLVHNAIDAGGAAPVRIVTGSDGGEPWIEVIDSGIGMTARFVRDELFRPFVSSKPGGFGIGAYEARQLTEAMGGRIAVESVPGRGTRFRVTLRAATGAMAAAA
ncbi:XrtA/PEP-CTERM system histidine kinase PrsK [Sphingomonas sp. VNH70]|uniref:XrtA/PEP-CTERM system histidine kinase PrsK n=1 Tax=Sphingomonas silueang TaxID=3156617 RepID=UPI0032B5A67E